MSPNTLASGWNATDDGESVPVRSSVSARQEAVHAADPVRPMADLHERANSHATVAADPKLMHLSALTGIGGVLLCAAFYFGFLNLKGALFTGDLTGTTGPTNVVITAAGEFQPASITVHPGDSVTFKNENADPQVLKSKDGKEVFPVQVLFTDPYTATVPADANGVYTYFSETLPEDKTLTINVTAALAAVSSSVASSQQPQNIDIPIPFAGTPGGDPVTVPVSVSSSSSSSSASVSYANGKGESTVITLGGTSSSSSSSATFDQSKIPTNPFTVGSGISSSASNDIVKNAANDQKLHSGAPLQAIKQHKPKAVTQTGPADTFALLFAAFAVFVFFYRRALSGLSF